MGDLAAEIEAMEADIHALDDALENGSEKNEDTTKTKSIFSRVGKSDSRRKEEGEDDEDDKEDDDSRRKRRSMRSAVVDTGRRRESDISKETIKEAQLGDEKQKRGAKRMFASLLGTLRTFDQQEKKSKSAEKRKEVEEKVEQRVAADKKKLHEERKELLQKKREKERLLDLLEQKKELSDLRGEWEDNFVERSKYIQTKTEPHIFWKPRIPDAKTKELMKKSKKTVEEQFEEAKQSWTAFKRELTSQIED
ncbi:unnamed protein product, partial [Oikopleura dioica]